MPRNIINYCLQLIVVIIPASLIFCYALNSGGLPDNDYWGEMAKIITPSHGLFSRNISDWLRRSNEHYTLLPKLVYALNLLLTGGNNVGLSLFSWFMALLQVPLLYRFIPVKNKQSPVLFILLLLAIAVFIFSPRQAHNWILGMSGTAWIMANFFSIAAIVALYVYVEKQERTYFYLVFIMGLCAVATYSTSLAIFPSLIIAAFLYRLRPLDQIVITVYGFTIIGLYLLTYSTPEAHPEIQQSFLLFVTYICSFLGALFTLQLNGALIAGIFGLVSSLIMIAFIYRDKTHWLTVIPWISIQLYACANAAMAALARSGFGMEQVFASRYGSLPALFWLSWIMLSLTLCLQLQSYYRRLALIIVLCCSSAIVIGTYWVGVQVATPLLERAEQKSMSLASIYSHAIDIELINATGLPRLSYAEMQSITNKLAAIKHIPFNGLFAECPQVGSKITDIDFSDNKQYWGNVDELRLRNDQIVELRGWAYQYGSKPKCIILTNQDHMVIGVAYQGLERLDVPKSIPEIIMENAGWQGYGKVHKHDKMIHVFMLSEKGYWLPITGSFQVFHQPLSFQKLVPIYENSK